jgi:hypothetical protein
MLRPLTAIAALLVLAMLAGACSSGPVSQATRQTGPPSASQAPATAPPEPTLAPATEPAATPDPQATPTPKPRPSPTPGIPPKPGGTTWTLVKQQPVKATGRILETYRITWTSPDGAADEFLVYGVKGCLREARKLDGKPCVVKGMAIPRNRLVKLASAPGDAREVQVTYEVGEIGPGPYGTILIRAANGAGNSIFTIAHSDDVCWQCTY